MARGATAWRLPLGAVAAVAVIIGPRRVLRWVARAVAIYGLTRRLTAALWIHPS
jgi:hypothetical protein